MTSGSFDDLVDRDGGHPRLPGELLDQRGRRLQSQTVDQPELLVPGDAATIEQAFHGFLALLRTGLEAMHQIRSFLCAPGALLAGSNGKRLDSRRVIHPHDYRDFFTRTSQEKPILQEWLDDSRPLPEGPAS